MKSKLLYIIPLAIVLTFLVATASPALAECDPGAGGIALGDCLKLSDDTEVQDKYTSVGFLINLIVRNAMIAASVLLFAIILFAAFRFISGGKKGAEEAKNMIVAALAGFFIMIAAYWIVQIVKVLTGADIPI